MTNKIQVYIVGGSVRDEIIGIKSNDVDYAIEAESYEDMKDWIVNQGLVIREERPQFVTIKATPAKGGKSRDFVLCRKESFYTDGRRPDNVEVGTIYDDLARRDFTMNAIAKDSEGNYIDPFDGMQDIKDRVIRCVGNANDRISEDWLRMLRAVRFSITKGFRIEGNIVKMFNDSYATKKLCETVSEERIREEVYKMFKADTRETIMFFGLYPKMSYACFSGNIWLKPTTENK